MTSSPTPAEGQTWQSLAEPSRTITLTSVDPNWTRFTADQESTYLGEPRPGWIQTRGLAQHFRLINPTP